MEENDNILERLRGINDKLDTIPRLDDIIAAWGNYTHLMAGEWQRFGNSLLDGRFVEIPELHKEGILLLSECRDLLLPYQELVSSIDFDFGVIRAQQNLPVYDYRDIDNRLDILVAFFNEFESAKYEIEALSPKSNQRHEDEKQPRPRGQSKAAARLQSQELQEVKSKLIAAGIIIDGVWQGTPAEYGELVRHLKDDCGVENRGGYAWKDCRLYAGYHGSDKSAQNAITSNQGDVRGDRAEAIRLICQRHKVR